MVDSKKPVIHVCIPTKGTVSIEWATLVLLRFNTAVSDWCELKVKIIKNRHSVTVARNELARNALKEGADYIFWLDDDMLFLEHSPMAALKMLYDLDAPIASGICQAQGGGFPIGRKVEGQRSNHSYTKAEIDQQDNVFNADLVGLFGCLVKREVIEKMEYPYFHWDIVCRSDSNLTESPSEDEYFMDRAHELGYKVTIRKDVQLGHMVRVMLMPDGSSLPFGE